MAFTKEELRKAIKDILKDADLDSLSAKKVRLSLQEKYDTDLTNRKKEIDELVMALISESQESQDNDESSDEEELDEPPPKKKKPTPTVTKSKPPPNKTPEKVKSNDMSGSSSDEDVNDEELAQKLQEELNDSGRRTRNKKPPKKPKKERKTGERKGTSTYSRPCFLSQELAAVMGAEQMARNEVVKKMWQIVKERNLQDPKNKQFMICDDQLLPLFGKKKIKTFGMMKYLKNHIKDAKDVAS